MMWPIPDAPGRMRCAPAPRQGPKASAGLAASELACPLPPTAGFAMTASGCSRTQENARRITLAGVLISAPGTRGDQAAALTGAGTELSDGSRST